MFSSFSVLHRMQSMQLRASLSLDLENLVGHYCLLHRLHVDAQVKVSKGSKSWRKTKQGVSGWSTLVGCKKQATCPTTTRLKRWEVAQQSLGGGVTTHWSKVWEKLLHTGESKADISPTASSQYSFFHKNYFLDAFLEDMCAIAGVCQRYPEMTGEVWTQLDGHYWPIWVQFLQTVSTWKCVKVGGFSGKWQKKTVGEMSQGLGCRDILLRRLDGAPSTIQAPGKGRICWRWYEANHPPVKFLSSQSWCRRDNIWSLNTSAVVKLRRMQLLTTHGGTVSIWLDHCQHRGKGKRVTSCWQSDYWPDTRAIPFIRQVSNLQLSNCFESGSRAHWVSAYPVTH